MDREPLEIPIQYVKGVGPQRARLLTRLGIKTARDAIYYLPYRYDDRRNLKKICRLSYGQMETTTGKIVSLDLIRPGKSRFQIFELTVSDGTGLLKGKWFNQPYMKKLFRTGREVILSGVVKPNSYWGTGFEMDKPDYEFTDDDAEGLIHTSRVVPVYRTTSGLSVRVLRSIMHAVVTTVADHIRDHIPEEMLSRHRLPGLRESIVGVHFPPPDADLEGLNRGVTDHHRRLSFDELFNLEIGVAQVVSHRPHQVQGQFGLDWSRRFPPCAGRTGFFPESEPIG